MPEATTPPVEVPGYEILEEIGRGGQARVYRARQVAVNRVVALKILDSARLDDTALRRFRHECESAGALSWHPHIVAVHDAGTTAEGLPYLAMEFLERGSLGERLEREGPLRPAEVAQVGVQLAGALETAHRAGMLHRDVKPDNVMVGPFGEAKLADFGIAAIGGTTVTATGTVTATLAHAAPEVLSGQRATAASDVYSLGSTLFALLTGKPAFLEETDESIMAIVARVATNPVPDLRHRGVPDALAGLIEAAMAKESGERAGSAAALGEALQEAQRVLGVPVTELRLRDEAAMTPTSGEATVMDAAPPKPPATVPRELAARAPEGPSGPSERERQGPPRRPRLRRLAWVATALAAVGIVLAAATLVPRGDERGARDTVGGGTGASATATGVPGTERWRFETGGSVGSPVVAGDLVYVGSGDNNLYALDAGSGEERWRFETGGFVGSPAVAGGVVYVGSPDNNLYALDAGSGEERWRLEAGGSISSPAVAGDLVYVGSDDNNVYAVDAGSGEERWRFETGGSVGSPVVAGDLIYVGSRDNNVYALDAETGEERWRFETGGFVPSPPAVAGDLVYVGSDDFNVYALDAGTGEERWRFETGGFVSFPAVAGDLVYVSGDDFNFYALDAGTGEERWRFKTGVAVGSPAVAGDLVYVGSGDNNVYALDAGTGEERWRFETGDFVPRSPAVAGGVVYVGSVDNNVYAINA